METIRMRIRISGRVQDVSFRAAARHEALRLGVSGFVRNESDGGVTIEAEGLRASVVLFRAWAGKGPERADVSWAGSEEIPPVGGVGFRIL